MTVYARSQHTVYSTYGLNEGMNSQTVYCATQDSEGFMWFGTDAGVSRFDGTVFDNFTTDHGLCDNHVLRIQEDLQGRIWFLSLSGCLAYYDHGSIFSSSNDPRLAADIETLGTTTMAEDRQGNLWFGGMDNYVARFDGQRVSLILPDSTDKGKYRYNNYVHCAGDGEMLFLRFNSVFHWKDGAIRKTKSVENTSILQNCFSHVGSDAYAITLKGLQKLENKIWVTLIDASHFSDLANSIGLCVHGNHTWVPRVTRGVEYLYREDDGSVIPKILFPDEWVNFVFMDRDENQWYCTREHGAYCVVRERLAQVFYQLDEPYQAMCFERTPDGKLHFGTSKGRVFYILDGSDTLQHVFDFEEVNIIKKMGASGGSMLQLLTDHGAYQLDTRAAESGTTEPLLKYDLSTPKDITLSHDHRLYFAGLTGLRYIDLTDASHKQILLNAVPPYRIYSLCAASDGRVWFENHDRLFFFRNDVVTEMRGFNQVSKGRISSVIEAPGGQMIVATMGSGLYFLDGESVSGTLSRANGLPSNECEWLRMFGDTCYVLTSGGLCSFPFSDGYAGAVRHFGSADGIPDARIFDTYVIGEDLYLATHAGVFKLPLTAPGHQTLPPRIHIRSVVSNGAIQNPYRPEIGNDQNLHIDFSAITFDLPASTEYQYALDENTAWTSTFSRSVEFSSLKPGTHTFRLRARKYNSSWSDAVSVEIFVIPPFWMAWWFRLLMVLVAAAFLYGVMALLARRKYRRQLARLEQEQALLRERNRISTDLHDDLGAELSNIVILSRIAGAACREHKDPLPQIGKIDHVASEVITKMNGIIWSLNPGNDSLQKLVDYIRRYAHEFMELNDLSGRVKVEGNTSERFVSAMVRRNVFLIVKEALHNVKKHAQASEVQVEIFIGPTTIRIRISDNGRGFVPDDVRAEGLGLASMKKRAVDMNARLEVESGERGTSVVLKLGEQSNAFA